MKCPKCQFVNPDSAKFCVECGHKFGGGLAIGGGRKQVTVLFSDLSGYTAMTEKLDPEEVKENMGRVFGDIAQAVTQYEGFIEKFVGDAVMALFGVPKTHEDDPVRAIRVAREIHRIVSSISPQYEKRINNPLGMHTGICTGLVVTGETNLETGTHGVLGGTINLASRLSGLAKPGEILVSLHTYQQAEGYFTFESLEPTSVKGKTDPVKYFKVVSPKKVPSKIHRALGLRADLIGRGFEMALFSESIEKLKQGKGSVISISGDAGTGKSRLIEEFRATLNLEDIQWREGHCYAYSQNTPYSLLKDLLSRAWHIEEEDAPEKVRQKLESGIMNLTGDQKEIIPYIGGLYSLRYPGIDGIGPDFWKMKLHAGIQSLLTALSQRATKVISFEDVHWADPSSIELLRSILQNFRIPALFICAYRPTFNLFTVHQMASVKELYQEIKLQDLSRSEAQSMVKSLLRTEEIPTDLRILIQTKVEGNPFYLEEVINSLIESKALIRENDNWKLTRSLREANIPATIQGVITARLDHLETESKRILQEASVIGRAFLYEILKRITDLKRHLDRYLYSLEQLDLIRTRALEPDLEYIFKHALTQDVAYNGLLKKERHALHERIGIVMEQLFGGRIPEFCETLAFHFKRGESVDKAVKYLTMSADKSLDKYAAEEAHQHYKDAFDILSGYPSRSKPEDVLLIDLILKWAIVFSIRADYNGLLEVFRNHEELAESLSNEEQLGLFYSWLGFALDRKAMFKDAYPYLDNGLRIGEKIGDQRVIGYACAFLAFTCAELGLLDEAITHGKRATDISWSFESDGDLFRMAWTSKAFTHYYKGECEETIICGKAMVDYGQRRSNLRTKSLGYNMIGMGHHAAGDFLSAIEATQKAIQVSLEPVFTCNAKCMLGFYYLSNGKLDEAEKIVEDVLQFTREFGYGFVQTFAQTLSAVVTVSKGNLTEGIRMTEEILQTHLRNGSQYRYAMTNLLLGRVYLKMIQGEGEKSLSFVLKNIGFLIKTVPFAGKKAEVYFNTAIKAAKEIGAKGILGRAYIDLGQLYKIKGKTIQARECFSNSLGVFEQCDAEYYRKQAFDALASLG